MTRILTRLLAMCIALASGIASAVTITYQLDALGGNLYRYTYTVSNSGPPLSDALLGFDIFFPDASGLTSVSPASITSAWDELTYPAVLTDPAYYDVEALLGGIAPGAGETGFAVEFVWGGSGLPGSQHYEIFDPNNSYVVVASGDTTPVSTQGVPEPASIALIAAGLLGLSILRRRQIKEGQP